MRQIKHFSILAGTAMLVACATQAPAPAINSAAPATALVATSTDKFSAPYGYTKVTMNGEVRYCRNDADPGSHVARVKVCYTEAQLKAVQNQDQTDLTNQIQKGNGPGASTGMQSGLGR
jgi:hypothetical protein